MDGDPQRNPPVVTLQTGECFPISALIESGPGESTYVAVADTFCYQRPAADVAELLRLGAALARPVSCVSQTVTQRR